MKRIKFLSVAFLAALTLASVKGTVSAQVVDATGNASEATDGRVAFKKDLTPVIPEEGGKDEPKVDPTDPDTEPDVVDKTVQNGDLAILVYPKEFNFGVNSVSAADKAAAFKSYGQLKHLSQNNATSTPTYKDKDGNDKETQYLAIWDGRVQNDKWKVSVSATTFTSTSGASLVGAKIVIPSFVKTYTHANATTKDNPASLTKASSLEIQADDTAAPVTFFEATDGHAAKDQSDILWNIADVTLYVPGNQLDLKAYASTITWTLSGTPDA